MLVSILVYVAPAIYFNIYKTCLERHLHFEILKEGYHSRQSVLTSPQYNRLDCKAFEYEFSVMVFHQLSQRA